MKSLMLFVTLFLFYSSANSLINNYNDNIFKYESDKLGEIAIPSNQIKELNQEKLKNIFELNVKNGNFKVKSNEDINNNVCQLQLNWFVKGLNAFDEDAYYGMV